MWYSLGKFILKNRLGALLFLLAATSVMGFYASKIQLSYDFTKAVPTDNPKFIDFRAFIKKFGADGNTMVIGVQSDKFFNKEFFNYLKPGDMIEDALARLIPEKQLALYKHEGCWYCMDTYRDFIFLNELWAEEPKWKIWK